MNIEMTPERFNTLGACMDLAIKAMGLRAMEADIIDLMNAIRAAAAPAPEAAE